MPQPRSSRTRARQLSPVAHDLYERRMALGLTQQQLADLSGVSRTSIQAIESGKTSVQLDSVLTVADVLGYAVIAVSASDLRGPDVSP